MNTKLKNTTVRPHRVLIVDDSRVMRDFLRKMLIELGFNHFIEASNAKDALAKYQQEQPHFTFLDIELGDESGLDVFEEILAEDIEAKVTIITAHSTIGNVKKAMSLGAKGFLVKPFQPQKLLLAVKNMSNHSNK
ncbi:response regulator [Catenovulum sp. 2E275]|uniref:response regulator n=1 Tax=Catenovulum sp. 2E275 TaxID=2980497 RepID=UPI0021CEBDE9|nr:response regulator [Catenovulum sp. 2E275]MCU4675452.1 response regulator [Catenovulum sp. 2E275]